MKRSTNDLIAELTNDLQPGRHWHPAARAMFWGGLFFLINVAGMLAYQAFRPHFLEQLLEHSRFSFEMLSIFLVIQILIFLLFSFMIPGRQLKKSLYFLLGFAGLVWLFTQWQAFGSATPPASVEGARPFCVEEVLLYGLIGIGFLFYFVQKAHFPFKLWQYFLMGFVSGLIPGALMQLACLYSPKHGLILHYAPAVVIGLLATALFPLLQKVRRSLF